MAENKVTEQTDEQEVEAIDSDNSTKEEQPRRRSSRKSKSWVKYLNVFEWFDRNQLATNMPYILFVTGLIMCYIANSYFAERLIRDIDKTKVELKERSAEFISTRSQLMFESKQSEVAKSVADQQLFESKEPPKKLFLAAEKESEQ